MANSAEYKTIIKNTANLRLAIKFNLTPLSGALLAKGLISADNEAKLRSPHLPQEDRAAELVEFVQNKVQQNPQHYYAFLAILREDEDQYADILHKLDQSPSMTKESKAALRSVKPTVERHTSGDLQEGRQSNYRGELNHLSQTGQIVDFERSFEEMCDTNSQRKKFKCTVSLKHTSSGKVIKKTSPPAEKKSIAEEQASEDVVRQIRNIERRRRPAETVDTCRAMETTLSLSKEKRPSSSPTPKSQLNEYFAKMYKGEAKPEYETLEKSEGGYRSTVTCRDIGRAVGEGSSKNAAEHDAASKILTKLHNLI